MTVSTPRLTYFLSCLAACFLLASAGCGDADDLYLSGEVTGLSGDGLILETESGEALPIYASQTQFRFFSSYQSGDDYEITITEQPDGFDCSLENASGTFEDSDVDDVVVACTEISELYVTILPDSSTLEAAPGEPIIVAAEVENTGGAEETQDVRLNVGGQLEDSTELTVGGEDTETVELQWDTDSVSPTSLVAEVSTDDSYDFTIVTVLHPAFYSVNIDLFESTHEVTQGWSADITADIYNVGQLEGEQTIELRVEDEVEDAVDEFVVAPGESESVTLSWDTADAGGDYELEVHSEDDYDTIELFVEDDCSEVVDVGDQCVDGTYYAGDYSGVSYFTTETAVGVNDEFKWAHDNTDTGATSGSDGEANTAILVDLEDGGEPYEAAEACGSLDEAGYDDWFLPAREQLTNTIGEHRQLLPDITPARHWSSTSASAPNVHSATTVDLDENTTIGTLKSNEYLVRCLRK